MQSAKDNSWYGMRGKISHTTIQAVDTPVEKCVVHNNNEEITNEKS